MRYSRVAVIFVVVGLLMVAWVVFNEAYGQQVQCFPRDLIVAQLQKEYNESNVGLGINKNGNMLEIFASKSGTWTMVLSRPDGNSCIMDTGHGWQQDKDHLLDDAV